MDGGLQSGAVPLHHEISTRTIRFVQHQVENHATRIGFYFKIIVSVAIRIDKHFKVIVIIDDGITQGTQGIDTVIGTKGVYLSGGEQQRIAIARVMLKNAPILILDEATAFADPENEALVQRAFERLSQGRTVIMIAHRLTTIKNAGCIFVLREGRVEESGTHDTLVAGGGLYAKMWQDYQTSVSWKVGAAK